MSTNSTAIQGVMPAPDGVTPNFSGKKTELQHQVIVIYSALTALSAVILGMRLYTRGYLNHSLGLDDFLIVLSWLGCVAWFAICVYAFRYGFGEHLWNITADQLIGYSKALVGICVVYVWTPALTKFSLLVLYHRINPATLIRIAVYALAVLIFGYSLSITIVVAGPCNPLTHTDPKCLKDLNLFMATINIITDFFIMLLPIPMLHQLHLPMKQKVALGIVFALGSGVIITSIVRIVYVYNYIGNPDSTYYQASACIFSEVELNAGVICASMVLLKPFIKRYMPCLLSFSSYGQSRTPSGSHSFGWFKKQASAGKSYELRSTDREAGVGSWAMDSKKGGAIEVTKSYGVSVGGRNIKGDGESTEEIIAPVSKTWNGR